METSVDFEEHLIQVPVVAGSRRLTAQAVGVSLTELETPFSDRLIRKADTPTGHQFFDIAKAQREAKVEPDAMTDDLSGKAMTMIKRDGAHPCSMPHERADCLFKAINLTIPLQGQIELSQRLAAHEKEAIEAALSESGGRVFGPSGAAAKLGIPRSTLESKIRSLKIDKNRFKTADRSRNN
jgi:transcriptional regulator with GAF, ATPase, and Fis domain